MWQLFFIALGTALFSANILETDHSHYPIWFFPHSLLVEAQAKPKWSEASACLQTT